LKIPAIDLRQLSDSECQEEIARQIQKAAESPFNFSAGTFLRAALVRLVNSEHILILTTHHIVSDAWSLGILTRELWSLYQTYAAGNGSLLEELPVQYGDFAVWQRNWLQGEAIERQLTYWKEQLKELTSLSLPADRPRPPRQSFAAVRCPITLSESLTTGIKELSNEFEVTPFMILLAAFQILLYRYCGQEDIVVGSAVANRARTELEPLVGFFINMLVLRSDLSGNPTFKELLARVREVCLGAYAHQDLPFEKLVQELQPERDQSRNPLFQVLFVLQNATRPFTAVPDLRIEPLDRENTYSQFDLSLFLREREGKYIGYIEYSIDLFDRDRIERLAGHYQILLEAIVADANQLIATVPILTDAERHRLLIEWNDTAADYPKDKCIHELFEAQVERTPDEIALEFEGEEITYRELNRQANQLAHYLSSLGLRPERLVGVYVERSIEMVVGLLGILKAGGAYVPLDPRYPRERVKFMIDDSGISTLLTQKVLLSSVTCGGMLTIVLDDLQPYCRGNKESPQNDASSDSQAYVIYTSGSSGIPKGVIGTHRAAVNRLAWMWERFPFESHEKCCVKTSLSFVDSIWEIFGPLLKGVRMTLIPDDAVKDIPRFVQILAHRQITRIVLVPSLLQSILDTVPNIQSKLPALKIWSSSGESLSKELAEQFRTSLPDRKLLNLYGSSEVAADVTFYDCCERRSGSKILIGRPINNTQAYILDSALQPQPIGVTGELFIGGVGLARGYLNRPELTEDKFIGNLFSNNTSSRLYRTGDVACYRPDGNIDLLGRLDSQVKVRGYRIELGEIESVIVQHPGIMACAVTVHNNDRTRSDQIVAYIVADCPIAEARRFVASKLPAYMVPSQFVILERLPLTSNGKVDRKALPLPNPVMWPTDSLVEARTDIEHLVAQVWGEMLKLDHIRIDDNFFELGGHSLLAAQIVTKLRLALAKQIPVRVLFEAPTIAQLAKALESIVLGGDEPDLPPIMPVSHVGYLPISLSQEPFYQIDQLIGGASFFNMPYAYRLSGPLNVSALERAIQEIVRRHASLRTVFSEVNERPAQSILKMQKIRLRQISLAHLSSDLREKTLKKLSRMDARQRFKLRTGPVLRVKLIRLEDKEHVLLVTMHHIITDQWSMGIFRSELGILYGAYSRGLLSPLPELSLQFVDFVAWEKRLLKQGLLQQQISYWQEQLAKPLPRLNFQRGLKRRRKRIRYRSSRQPIEIDAALFQAIKSFARSENCTAFMVFVTALTILLHLLTSEHEIRISTLVANRGQPGTSQMVGYLANMLILRNHVAPDMPGRELLQQVRDTCLSAYAHQDLPFDYLECLFEKAGVKKQLCQVMLNYRNFPIPDREMCGLTIASWNGHTRMSDPSLMISQLDMMIHLRDTATKVTGAVNYKTDLFTDERVRMMMDSFRGIITHLTTRPDSPVIECLVYVDV
jgi:amino acid adenylation domain-containing protein